MTLRRKLRAKRVKTLSIIELHGLNDNDNNWEAFKYGVIPCTAQLM